jgi:parvulin-like peptidyl-prolyl isomerase
MNRRQTREPRSNRRTRTLLLSATLATLVLVAWARAQAPAPTRLDHPRAKDIMATVGGRPIDYPSYERVARGVLQQALGTRTEPLNPSVDKILRRQALEQLIRNQLLILEAKRQKIAVSTAEVDAEFRNHPFFTVNGQFDSARFANVKKANSPEYQASIGRIREDLAARKLDAKIRAQYAPDLDPLRQRVERRRTSADLAYYALRTSEFDGDYPEPTEAEVLAYYRAHQRDFSRRDRAEIAAFTVTAENENDRGAKRTVADSVLRELERGASYDDAAATFGGARRGLVVSRGNFPADWSVTPSFESAVFQARPGTVVAEAVASPDGWHVVRVQSVSPAGPAPLSDVSREIRRILRDRAKAAAIEGPMRKLYDERKSMLKQPGYRVRYARFDAERMPEPKASSAELERYYRAHMADFSVYDERTGTIRTRELNEVRDQVAIGWRNDQRVRDARAAAEKLHGVWERGRRDRGLERTASVMREPEAVPIGAAVDTGSVGAILGDTLTARAGALGVGMMPVQNGAVVFDVYERLREWVPSFESYRPTLEAEWTQTRVEQKEKEARALFERDPLRFAEGDVVHFTEMIVVIPNVLDVQLTRAEVERYHLEHIENYAAAEEVRVRHILISPKDSSPQSDAEARRKAESLLARIRGGEQIQDLAAEFSEDPATRDKGGDVGFFSRGRMLPEFERVSFSLKPGEVSELVRTQVGYHIIQLADHVPLSAEPLVHIYPNVGSDAATDKGERIAQARADSLRRVLRTVKQAEAAAKLQGHEIWKRRIHTTEIDALSPRLQPYFRSIQALKPGQILGDTRYLKGHGIAFAWLDSIAPENQPEWSQARDKAMAVWEAERTASRLEAKRAELDSMEAAGWSPDSLAALWGGFERVTDIAPGRGLPTLGAPAIVDSLTFGGTVAPMPVGRLSGWVDLGRAIARLRVTDRRPPSAQFVDEQVERERRLEVERGLYGWYDRLKGTFAVQILDRELADVSLPQPPPTE